MDQFPPVVTQEQMLRRICSEFLEMPGLRLNPVQARRLWGLDEATCAQLLHALVESGFLCRNVGDLYARLTDGPVEQPVFATARSERAPRRGPIEGTGKKSSAA